MWTENRSKRPEVIEPRAGWAVSKDCSCALKMKEPLDEDNCHFALEVIAGVSSNVMTVQYVEFPKLFQCNRRKGANGKVNNPLS